MRWKRSPGGKKWGRYGRKVPGEHPERWLSVKEVAKVYQGCQMFLCRLLDAETGCQGCPSCQPDCWLTAAVGDSQALQARETKHGLDSSVFHHLSHKPQGPRVVA